MQMKPVMYIELQVSHAITTSSHQLQRMMEAGSSAFCVFASVRLENSLSERMSIHMLMHLFYLFVHSKVSFNRTAMEFGGYNVHHTMVS